jgi:hypothetical protein
VVWVRPLASTVLLGHIVNLTQLVSAELVSKLPVQQQMLMQVLVHLVPLVQLHAHFVLLGHTMLCMEYYFVNIVKWERISQMLGAPHACDVKLEVTVLRGLLRAHNVLRDNLHRMKL